MGERVTVWMVYWLYVKISQYGRVMLCYCVCVYVRSQYHYAPTSCIDPLCSPLCTHNTPTRIVGIPESRLACSLQDSRNTVKHSTARAHAQARERVEEGETCEWTSQADQTGQTRHT
jgi:hypothetical protein